MAKKKKSPEAPEAPKAPEAKIVKMFYPHNIERAAHSQTIYGYDAKQIDNELWEVEVPMHQVKSELNRQFGKPLLKKKPAKKK